MAMSAQIRTDSNGDITVHIKGGLDYENGTPLKNELESLLVENPASLIIIDLHALDFVGSSGIGQFVDTVKLLNSDRPGPRLRLSNVTNEFLKVFKLYDENITDFVLKEFDDDETETLGERFGSKRNRFQN
jgi:anti-sigma B factor antagonist